MFEIIGAVQEKPSLSLKCIITVTMETAVGEIDASEFLLDDKMEEKLKIVHYDIYLHMQFFFESL